MPMRSASTPSMISPRSTRRLACCRPTTRERSHAPPKSADRPRLTKISEKRACGVATTKSAPMARLHPAPTATPLTTEMTGLGISYSDRAMSPKSRMRVSGCCSRFSPPRSAPAQKSSPAPVRMTARTEGSLRTWRTTSPRRYQAASVMAFLRRGWLSVIVAMPSATDRSTGSVVAFAVSPFCVAVGLPWGCVIDDRTFPTLLWVNRGLHPCSPEVWAPSKRPRPHRVKDHRMMPLIGATYTCSAGAVQVYETGAPGQAGSTSCWGHSQTT